MRMRLYIVRHAEAENMPPAASDEERALTDKGRESVPPIGKLLNLLEIAPDIIWTSPVLRARQTADLLAGSLSKKPPIEELDYLGCGSDFNDLRKALKECSHEDLVIVGHMPFLGECVQYWMTGHAHPGMNVPKASCICLEARGFNRANMNMKFMLTRKMIEQLTRSAQ